MRWLGMLCACLPMLVMAQDWVKQPIKATIKACERQHNAQACWALSQAYGQGKGVQRNRYNADAYSFKACDYAKHLTQAKLYCSQAIRNAQTWSNGQCIERDIYHHLCEQGSRAYCTKMATLYRQGWGWRGGKEGECWDKNRFGDGTPSPLLAIEYEKKALVAPFD